MPSQCILFSSILRQKVNRRDIHFQFPFFSEKKGNLRFDSVKRRIQGKEFFLASFHRAESD